MKITYTPSYIHPNKFSISSNEPHKYQLNQNKKPVKLVEPHSNTFNKINNFYSNRNINNFKNHNLTNSQGNKLDKANKINCMKKQNLVLNNKKNYKKFLKKNISSSNTGVLTNVDSKILNSGVTYSDENNLISSSDNNNNSHINFIKNQKEIPGLNYQDLVNIVNRRKQMLENNNINPNNNITHNKNNIINLDDNNNEYNIINNQVNNILEKENDDVQSSFLIEEESNLDNFPIIEDKKYENKEEKEVIKKEEEKEKEYSRNNELFSSISSINSNLKGLTKHQKIQKQNNKQNNNNNLINSSEFDVVNTDEYKITKNEVTLNTETDFNIENNTELKELIDLNPKDDFKIEHNPETGGNSLFQDKTSLFESMINPNLQQSKSLISLTQKNDIEITQVEEYDQDKFRLQNETKDFSTFLNITPNNFATPNCNNNPSNNKEKNENSNQKEIKFDSVKDTLKTQYLEEKMNFFEDTIQQYPKKQVKDKINDKYINQNSKRSLFENLPLEPIVLGKMDVPSNNNRYDNYFPKEFNKISNSKIVSQMNQNFNIKSPNHLNEKLKIPLPQKSSEHFLSNNKKKNSHFKKKNNLNLQRNNILSQRKNKFNNHVKTQENEKKLNHSDGNKKFSRSCSKNNYNSNKKKTRKIENYSDYYKKKVDLITKEETKIPSEENKNDDESSSNKSMETNNNILVINVNNSNPKNNLFYKLQAQRNNNSSRGTLSENSKDKIGKHNKSTYY